jgi:hypothetical protein
MTEKIDRKDDQNRQGPGGLLDRIVSRGFAYYNGKKIVGEILSEVGGMVEIYPGGETGPRDCCSWMFHAEEVTRLPSLVKKYRCEYCGKYLFKHGATKCHKCGLFFCAKHIYSYVDESNHSITKNSPEFCKKCYG